RPRVPRAGGRLKVKLSCPVGCNGVIRFEPKNKSLRGDPGLGSGAFFGSNSGGTFSVHVRVPRVLSGQQVTLRVLSQMGVGSAHLAARRTIRIAGRR
ncbi:MAG TPA: hypothetical protein VHE14_00180, partial [Solirubrobacteraceae bacterium]|nr:hypothetical protein [Solirubrobacteraceae bacterium]